MSCWVDVCSSDPDISNLSGSVVPQENERQIQRRQSIKDVLLVVIGILNITYPLAKQTYPFLKRTQLPFKNMSFGLLCQSLTAETVYRDRNEI